MSETSAKKDDVTIRLATLADGPRCNAFHNAYYKLDRTLVQWQWEFGKDIAEDGTLPFAIAEADGAVVGTQALIRVDMIDGRGVFRSAKSEETLVSSTMRGRSLFARMYEPLLEYVRKNDIQAIWGFTPAVNAFRSAGFAAPGETSQILRTFGSGAAAALLSTETQAPLRKMAQKFGGSLLAAYAGMASWLHTPRGHGLEMKRLDKAPDWSGALSEKFVARWGGCTIHRSAAYLQWRIFDNPYCRSYFVAAFHAGEPVGFVCYAISDDKVASIVDIVAVDGAGCDARTVTLALMDAASRHSRSLGVVAIRCWSVTAHPYDQLVRAASRKLGWIFLRRGFGVILREFKVGETPLPGFQEWYVSRLFTEGTLG